MSTGWISVQEDQSGTASRGQTDELSLKVTMVHNNGGAGDAEILPTGGVRGAKSKVRRTVNSQGPRLRPEEGLR